MKCTYCRDLQKQGEQCMSDARPELLKEWHPSRNSGLKAREVACTHGDKVWWLCKNGHEWQATIRSRLTGKPCPFCSSCIEKPLYSSVSNTVDSRVVWCRRFEQERGRYSRYGIGVSLI